MEIQTVKEIRDIETNELQGYLVDGTKSVPLAEGNRDYKEVLEWLEEGNEPEPAFTEEELAERAKQKQIADAKQYLSSTDWVVVKINEANISDDDISSLLTKYAEILTARADARATINSLE